MDAIDTILTVTEHYRLRTTTQNNEYLPPHPNLAFRPLVKIERCRPTLSNVFHNQLRPYDYSGRDSLHSSEVALLQLVHALYHLHSHGWVHRSARIDNIYITSNSKRLVLIVDSKIWRRQSRREDQVADITALGRIFREILSGNTRFVDDFLSHDLLAHMNVDATIWNTGELLKHPFFWDVQKKVSFLVNVAQFSKCNEGCRLKAQLDADEVLFDQICQTDHPDGWKSRLELNPREKDRFERILKKRSEQTRLRKDPMKSLYEKKDAKGKNNYDGKKIQSLLNFIRNRVEHFHEDSFQVQACFLFDKVNGIYCFFSHRFPHLFLEVYKIVVRYTESNTNSGIEQFFTKAENRDFPAGR